MRGDAKATSTVTLSVLLLVILPWKPYLVPCLWRAAIWKLFGVYSEEGFHYRVVRNLPVVGM